MGRLECVAYLTSPADDLTRAIGHIHPRHLATSVMTEVDAAELARVWDELAASARSIVCQVHTHPGSAFHSGTDDHYPVVHSKGFLSLVVPRYGSAGTMGAHLAVYEGAGRWASPDRWDGYLVIGE